MLSSITLGQAYSFIQLGQRDNQEDARFPNLDMPSHDSRTFLVCDGVGGQDKGEIASRTVCGAFGQYMSLYKDGRDFTATDFQKALSVAYSELHKAMNLYSKEMATTLTFLHIDHKHAFVAHMGDSRIYQIRPGVGIMYRSNDHSLVNALVHSGNITPQEAINHPKGNYITRCMSYVGSGQDYPPAETLMIDDVEAGDYFFLCSDGVLHCIDDEELYKLFSSSISDEEKYKTLANKCVRSSDNNTAIFVQVVDVTCSEDSNESQDSSMGSATEMIDIHSKSESQIVEISPSADESPLKRIANFVKNLF